MAGFRTIDDVYTFLNEVPMFQKQGASAAKYGLERIQWMCARMGHPEKKLPYIHIAGTNGKGSVAGMLACIYQQAGYKCGLYTSPHLVDVRERFRINRVHISEESLLSFFKKHGDEIIERELSYFEMTTAVAFWWFAENKVDLAILETGLGGRLDATNVVSSQVSVITSIGLDHTDFLGHTIEQIASEKAGIIKKGQPVVIGDLNQEALKVIEDKARVLGSQCCYARSLNPEFNSNKGVFYLDEEGRKEDIDCGLYSPVQAWNMAMSRQVTHCMSPFFPVSWQQFTSALKSVMDSGYLAGRFEQLHPDMLWFFDGAHNEEAVGKLIETIQAYDWDEEPVIVLSVMKDKAEKKMLNPFSVFKKNYYYVSTTERAADIAQLKPYLKHITCLPPDEEQLVDFFSGLTEKVVIFTGSFYFYGKVRRWISHVIKTV